MTAMLQADTILLGLFITVYCTQFVLTPRGHVHDWTSGTRDGGYTLCMAVRLCIMPKPALRQQFTTWRPPNIVV